MTVAQLSQAEDAIVAAILVRQAIPANPLAATASRPAVFIQTGPPFKPDDLRPEHIFTLQGPEQRIPETSGALADLAGTMFRADAEIMVRVWVERSSDNYKATRDRADAIRAEVETAINADATQGGAVRDSNVTSVERPTGNTELGRAVEHTVIVGLWWMA